MCFLPHYETSYERYMIKELQLRVTPNVAYNELETKIYVSTVEDVDVNRIRKIQILKR